MEAYNVTRFYQGDFPSISQKQIILIPLVSFYFRMIASKILNFHKFSKLLWGTESKIRVIIVSYKFKGDS